MGQFPIYFNVLLICALLIHSTESTRIVGGENINITEVPYQISLRKIENDHHACGGSILNARWILTAAHCGVEMLETEKWKVVVGMTKLSEGGTDHRIKHMIIHPKFGQHFQYNNDIALIKLNQSIQFNNRVQPLRLPSEDDKLPVGQSCRIQGWGRLWNDGDRPNHLQAAELPILKPEECSNAYKHIKKQFFLGPHATMICAGWKGGKPDTCKGDSGGALVCNGTQFGIVSYSVGCANPDYPTVFSHVKNLRKFIKDVAGL